MKPQNKQINGRKVECFFENIFKNFGTIVLGALLFGLIFMGYFLLNTNIQEKKVEYAAVTGFGIEYKENAKEKVSKDKFEEIARGEKVRQIIESEVVLSEDYSKFLNNLQVDYNDGVFKLSFFDKDETYSVTVLKKFFMAATEVLMEEYEISSVPYEKEEKPITYMVYTKSAGFLNSIGIVKFSLIGAIVGIVFSFIAISAFYLLDNTVKNSVDVRRYFDLPVLSVIPTVREKDEENS